MLSLTCMVVLVTCMVVSVSCLSVLDDYITTSTQTVTCALNDTSSNLGLLTSSKYNNNLYLMVSSQLALLYKLIYLAKGGNWPGYTIAPGPHVMLVDWVRVWQY